MTNCVAQRIAFDRVRFSENVYNMLLYCSNSCQEKTSLSQGERQYHMILLMYGLETMIQVNLSAKQTYRGNRFVVATGVGGGMVHWRLRLADPKYYIEDEQETGPYCVTQGTVFTIL